jgi:RNA polymerase sigma-70 factor (ECF subfamily)
MKVLAGAGDPWTVEALSPAPAPALVGSIPIEVGAIYREHAPFLSRVLIRLVGDGPHVDDLVQETFIVAWRKRGSFDGRCAPRTWLYGIAARLAMRHRRGVGRWLRALRTMAEQPAEVVTLDRQLEAPRASAAVHQAIAALPFGQREVFVLYELEELEGAQIAELLGIPVNTVWTRLHHGRKRFQDALRRQIEGSPHGA